MAPTYTIMNKRAIKSNPICTNSKAEDRKLSTNQKTECTGLKTDITIVAVTIIAKLKIKLIGSMNSQGQVPLPSLCYDLLCLLNCY